MLRGRLRRSDVVVSGPTQLSSTTILPRAPLNVEHSSAEVSDGFPNGGSRTLTENVVVTDRTLFLSLIFMIHSITEKPVVPSGLINSLTLVAVVYG